MCNQKAGTANARRERSVEEQARGRRAIGVERPRGRHSAAVADADVISLLDDDDDDAEEEDVMTADNSRAAQDRADSAQPTLSACNGANDTCGGPPWWTILPDFVPVAALRDGRDPRWLAGLCFTPRLSAPRSLPAVSHDSYILDSHASGVASMTP